MVDTVSDPVQVEVVRPIQAPNTRLPLIIQRVESVVLAVAVAALPVLVAEHVLQPDIAAGIGSLLTALTAGVHTPGTAAAVADKRKPTL